MADAEKKIDLYIPLDNDPNVLPSEVRESSILVGLLLGVYLNDYKNFNMLQVLKEPKVPDKFPAMVPANSTPIMGLEACVAFVIDLFHNEERARRYLGAHSTSQENI